MSAEHSAETWRNIALYLATCHAATYEDQRDLKSVSGYRRNRLRSVCTSALRMLETGYLERSQNYEHVTKRLKNALSPPPPSGEGGK